MASSKERAPGAKKKTRKRSGGVTSAAVRKKTRTITRAGARSQTRRVSRAVPVDVGQKDFFGDSSAVSPQVGQAQVRRGSLVLSPTIGHSNLLLVSAPVAAEPSPRRRVLYLILLLLLMSGSFWLGRFTNRPLGAAVDFTSQAPASITAPTSGAAAATSAPAAHTGAAKPAANVTSRIVASIKAKVASIRRGSGTELREVSVGTSSRGGLTLKFDHPVTWMVKDNGGRGEAEVDIAGVHNLGTFPRNLPLPPGVMVIHAGLNGPDTLRLWFTLLPNLRISSSPESGPSPVLNVYFRTDTASTTTRAQPQAAQPIG